ncbi:MAG: D-alanyl-D-alanine endopeptidase [Gammaproteobacteria bacterium]|nr:D-alanyl-D-alanine endopeptidase [Gammaproteobacteria bacterium]
MRIRVLLAGLLYMTVQIMPAAAASAAAPSPEKLQLASVHAVVRDLAAGETLYRKFADVPVPMASVTKVMTAMVVLDGGQPLDEWLTIVDWNRDLQKNAYSRLRIGSQAKRGELLRIALMSSENLATNVLASHYPGGFKAFIAAMNAKAESLGMNQTRFVDPAGLSPDNHASADDLARMLQAAYGYETIRQLSTGYQHTARFRKPRYALGYGNTNPLVASSRWNLALTKTGYLSEAGRCLVMVTEVDGRPVAMVLLNSFGTRTPLGDAGRVRRWLTTGNGGTVAGPALAHERRRTQALQQARAPSEAAVR